MHTSENDAVAQYVDKQTEMGAGASEGCCLMTKRRSATATAAGLKRRSCDSKAASVWPSRNNTKPVTAFISGAQNNRIDITLRTHLVSMHLRRNIAGWIYKGETTPSLRGSKSSCRKLRLDDAGNKGNAKIEGAHACIILQKYVASRGRWSRRLDPELP